MARSDFDPRLSPFLGDLIERRRKLVDVLSQQGGDQDPEAAAPTLVQLAVLQSCICAVAEVIEEARVTAKLDPPNAPEERTAGSRRRTPT